MKTINQHRLTTAQTKLLTLSLERSLKAKAEILDSYVDAEEAPARLKEEIAAINDLLEVLDVNQWSGTQDIFVQYTTGFHREGV